MARYISKVTGLLFLFAGICVGLIDGTRSIAANALDWTSFGGALNWLFPNRMAGAQETVSKNLHPALWDPAMTTLFSVPALALFFATGTIFLIVARDKMKR